MRSFLLQGPSWTSYRPLGPTSLVVISLPAGKCRSMAIGA